MNTVATFFKCTKKNSQLDAEGKIFHEFQFELVGKKNGTTGESPNDAALGRDAKSVFVLRGQTEIFTVGEQYMMEISHDKPKQAVEEVSEEAK